MNVMDRPLFRQAGGPMEPMPADMMPPAPAPMPADMGMGAAPPPPPPDMGMAMEQAHMEGMEEGAAIGEQYMAETLMNIDGSENYESLINGLRGNEMPLQARYAELAEFVGPDDAQATPESVLALTQPGIMMTEQGAASSGIGQLMQGMVDDVAMTTDTGPTPMGQGIGELMMSGAPEAPVPQNFRYGGAVGMHKGTPVQKFQDGMGAASVDLSGLDPTTLYLLQMQQQKEDREPFAKQVKGQYEELGPLFQDLVPQTYPKSDFLFDVAQAGLAYASGRDPMTGENMAGQSGLAQLARAATPLPAAINKRLAEHRKSQQAAKTGALGAAISRATSVEASDEARELALLKIASQKNKFEDIMLQSPDGKKTLMLNRVTPSGGVNPRVNELLGQKWTEVDKSKTGQFEDIILQSPDGKKQVILNMRTPTNQVNPEVTRLMEEEGYREPPSKSQRTTKIMRFKNINTGVEKTIDVNADGGLAEMEMLKEQGFREMPAPTAADINRATLRDLIEPYSKGETTTNETTLVQQAISAIVGPIEFQKKWDPQVNDYVTKRDKALDGYIESAEDQRRVAGLSTSRAGFYPRNNFEEKEKENQTKHDYLDPRKEAFDAQDTDLALVGIEQSILDRALADPEASGEAFGRPGFIDQAIDTIVPVFREDFTGVNEGLRGEISAKLKDLNVITKSAMLQARGGRLLKQTENELNATLPKTGLLFSSKSDTRKQIKATLETLQQQLVQGTDALRNGTFASSEKEYVQKLAEHKTLKYVYQGYRKLYDALSEDAKQDAATSGPVSDVVKAVKQAGLVK